MRLKKLIQDNISNEELLEILKEDITSGDIKTVQMSEIERTEDEVISFMRFYNIENGKYYIQDKVIYNLYKLFSKNPISTNIFFGKLRNYILTQQRDNRTFYRINKKATELDDKAYEFIKKTIKSPVKNPTIRRHFENFINKYDIKRGDKKNFVWIQLELLYSLYDEYAYSVKRKIPLSLEKFEKFVKLYFTYKISGIRKKYTTYWFYIHDDIEKILTKERISSILAGSNKQNAKKKENKKKQF